eukprot:CAMPEP_0206385826 /NCGR_PEP_ID=MMETSP0294-20121207/15528_1 /ASSEMBLY_ACC=CAM_ASM_000327 /TAXON_ID=39354 /ORGANISM="Heterosigma akashiwo, Strain CCMP2393" /LENGTH=133 /DNA_ID=CAMNT_0053836655 /DNA_START=13 /DNA_END=411 /DNA_ORIENTATION=-
MAIYPMFTVLDQDKVARSQVVQALDAAVELEERALGEGGDAAAAALRALSRADRAAVGVAARFEEQDALQQQILHYVDHLRFDKAIELINPLLELSSRLVEESEELFMLLQPDFCSSEGIIGSEYSSGGKGEW